MDWIVLELSGGVPGLFKVKRDAGTCRAYFWDLKQLYGEELAEREVLERAQTRNRSFEYDLDNLIDIFSTKPKECRFSGGDLNLKYYVHNIPFHIHWRLVEDSQGFSEVVAIPLLLALKHTKDREVELLKIVEQKDHEIQDYRMNEIPLTNKFLETKPLDCRSFQRSTAWDCIEDPANKELLVKCVPGFSDSGFIPVAGKATVDETDRTGFVEKITTKGVKRTMLKKIQGDKIGTKPVVEFKYSQDTPEETGGAEEVEDELGDPVKPSATIITSQKISGPSNKRRLKDVL